MMAGLSNSRAAAEIAEVLAQPTGSITDETTTLDFAAVSTAVAEIAEALERAGITDADCVSFGCDNSVASAVMLLALMASGRSFVLRPLQERSIDMPIAAPDSETFSRFTLQAGRRGRLPGAIEMASADISVAVARRDGWRANLPPGPPSHFLPTSGSTGPSKLVRHAHDRFVPGSRNSVARLCLTAADRIAIPVPLSHMYGLRGAFGPALVAGAALDLQANANPLRVLARERDFSPNVAFLTPSLGEMLLAVRKSSRAYRLTVMSGDGLSPDLFDKYEARHGCVVNSYGSTELGAVATGDPGDPIDLRRSTVGPFLDGAALCTDPPAPLEDAEPADPHLLWFRHTSGFLGYVDVNGQQMRRADGFLPSGDCYCSGDVGNMVNGCLVVTGRADDKVKRDGVFVTCADVAEALRGIDGIAQAFVLAGDMTRRGRALVAFCVPQSQDRADMPTLRRAARNLLPPHAVPDSFFLLPEMPLLPNGKVNRKALRLLYETGVI